MINRRTIFFRGKVVVLSALTGLFFSALPAQVAAPSWLAAFGTGGGFYENGGGIRAGNNSKIYCSGRYAGSINMNGSSPAAATGATDCFSAQLTNTLSGAGQWATKVHTSGGYDYVFGFNIDVNNNSYTVGTSNSGAAFYLAKTSPAGTLLGSWNYGTNGGANGVCADAAGNIYVTGGIGTSQTIGGFPLTYLGGGSDVFVAKINSAGVVQWIVNYGGAGYDAARAIEFDQNGNLWVCGGYTGTPTFGSFTAPAAGAYSNLFVGEFNPANGSCMNLFTASNAGIVNGGWYEENDLRLDSCNNIYVTGHFEGTATFGTITKTSAGSDDMFITKINPAGVFQWVQTGGGPGADQGEGVALDKNWDVVVGGYFSGTATFGTTSVTATGNNDAFVAKYASGNGALLYVQKGGGLGYEDIYGGLTVDNNRQVFLTGGFSDNNVAANSTQFGPFNLGNGYYGDIYVAKLDSTPNLRIIPQLQSSYCAGQCYSLSFTTIGTFNAGNVFTAELSDPTGSFASGTTSLGTLTATSSGVITICFPAAASGNNYQVRITSTNPAYSSVVKCGNPPSGGTQVAVNPPPAVTLTSQTNVACFGGNNGNATVNVTGGTPAYTYSWTSGGTAATENNLTAGNYTVTVTDASGCSQTQSVTITQAPQLTVTTAQTNPVCNGNNNGDATVSVSGGTPGYTYSWSSGGTNATENNLAAGSYSCTITDANGCSQQETFTITQPAALSVTPAQTNVLCNGNSNGNATVSVSGGTPNYTYSWSSGGTNATENNLIAGNYTCTITDANGCSQTQTFSITQPSALSATATAVNSSCSGNNGSATANPAGGTPAYTYSWSSGGTGATENNLGSGTYTCTITDANGCSTSVTATVTTSNGLAVSLSSQTNVTCNGAGNGSATVNVNSGTPPYTYSWNSGGTNATENNLAAGTYTCTVTDANGCTQTQTVTITQPAALSITPSQTNVLCNGTNSGIATVNASGGTPGYTYSWSNGASTASINSLGAGTYTCTITDANGCSQQQIFSITQPSAISVSASSTPQCGANNGIASAVASGGTGAYTYSWSPSGGNTSSASGLTSGNYTCTVTDANGCSQTQTVTVVANAGPSASVSPDTTINIGMSVALTAGGGATYVWSPSTGLSCSSCQNPIASPTQTTSYCVQVTDTNGCSNTACMTVNVTYDCGEVFVPNAFSPNNDNENDRLCVYGTQCMTTMQFVIFDRWGEKVFESSDPNTCWDGTFRGKTMDSGVYVYYLNATLVNGQQVSKKGNIALVR